MTCHWIYYVTLSSALALTPAAHATAKRIPPAVQQAADRTPAILKAYLALHASLVAGDAKWATTHATALAAVSGAAPELAKSIANYPTDIATQRKRFSAVSEAAIGLAARSGDAAAGLHVVFCSMAPGRWLQRGVLIKNPYYGKDMLTCGAVQGPPKDVPNAQ